MLPANLFVIGPRVPDSAVLFWTIGGAVSAGLAMWVALQPGMLLDLWSVREWLHLWRAGGDPYASFDNIDYPPNALIVLAPLALFSDAAIVTTLLVAIVVSAAAGTLLLLRWFAEQVGIVLTPRAEIALVAMMFADAALRGTLWRGQTAPFAILFGALALRWCTRHPVAAAIALSLCAFKPHVALGFGLAAMFTKRFDVVLGAVLLSAAQVWLFAVSIDRGVIDLLTRYVQILTAWYSGDDAINGLLSIPWVLEELIGHQLAAFCVSIALAAGSLALLWWHGRQSAEPHVRAIVVSALLLWSLVFLPHQLYHGALALPAVWLLMWPQAVVITSTRARALVVAAVVLVSAADLPRAVLWMTEHTAELEWLTTPSYFIRPLILSMMLALLVYRVAQRRTPAAS